MKVRCSKYMMVAWIAGALILMGGCDNPAPPKKQPKMVRQKVATGVTKTALNPNPAAPAIAPPATAAMAKASQEQSVQTADDIHYDPKGKIDPFEPLFKAQASPEVARKKKAKRRQPATPLEKIDLSQLKLTAIIRSPRGNKAMLEEASGKGYLVEKGTYVGLHGGRVIAVLNDRIRIEEEIETILGDVKTRISELTLPKPPGER